MCQYHMALIIVDLYALSVLVIGRASSWGSQAALVVKNLPAKAGDGRDAGSVPRSERAPGGGHSNPL